MCSVNHEQKTLYTAEWLALAVLGGWLQFRGQRLKSLAII